jgi:hypothetical protein
VRLRNHRRKDCVPTADFGLALFTVAICVFLCLLGLWLLFHTFWSLAKIPSEWREASGRISDAYVDEHKEFGESTEYARRCFAR